MINGGPESTRNKFNLISQEEIKRAIAELKEVNKQIENRSRQIKKMTETHVGPLVNTTPGTLNFKDLDPEKNVSPKDLKK
jgi:hypothetical protein